MLRIASSNDRPRPASPRDDLAAEYLARHMAYAEQDMANLAIAAHIFSKAHSRIDVWPRLEDFSETLARIRRENAERLYDPAVDADTLMIAASGDFKPILERSFVAAAVGKNLSAADPMTAGTVTERVLADSSWFFPAFLGWLQKGGNYSSAGYLSRDEYDAEQARQGLLQAFHTAAGGKPDGFALIERINRQLESLRLESIETPAPRQRHRLLAAVV